MLWVSWGKFRKSAWKLAEFIAAQSLRDLCVLCVSAEKRHLDDNRRGAVDAAIYAEKTGMSLALSNVMKTNKQLIYTLDFAEVGLKDISRVGGKNASLGELFNALKSQGVGVIDGFATTADAYRALLAQGQLEYELRSLAFRFRS